MAGLTGTLVTELSSASATGLLDLATRAWSPEAIALAGVSAEQLPEILPTTASCRWRRRSPAGVGLRAGTPVVTGAADGPLGNLGTGALARGVAGSVARAPAARSASPSTRHGSTRPGALLLRAHGRDLDPRRRDQQRRRRRALGRALAGARRRVRRRGPGRRGARARGERSARQRRPRHAALPAGRARAAVGPGRARRLSRRAPRAHARALRPRRDRGRRPPVARDPRARSTRSSR